MFIMYYNVKERRYYILFFTDNKHLFIYISCALAVQIYLQMDRLDLARKEVAQAKSWAEDALLLQMMEAWVDLRVVMYFFRC